MKHVEIDGKDVSVDQGQTMMINETCERLKRCIQKLAYWYFFLMFKGYYYFQIKKFTFSNSGLDTGICN